MPALPLDEAGKYVAAAYVVFLLLILVYVAIIGMKVSRIEREVGELLELTEEDESPRAREVGHSPTVQESPEGEQSTQRAGLEAPPR
ncbi:MAG: hypothetical protein ACR2HC_02065 [Thermoleophilaceae bacterium]